MQHEQSRHDGSPPARGSDGAPGARDAAVGALQSSRRPAGRRQRGATPPRERTAGSEPPANAEPAGPLDAATVQAVRKGVTAMLVAAAVLLVFNSAALRMWTRGLPGSAMSDVLVAGADWWHGLMQRAGVAAAAATVRDAVADFRGQSWPDVDILSVGRADVGKKD